MCVRVQYSSLLPADPWDPSARVITLPVTLPASGTAVVVRALLKELAVEQPPDGARCFCGASIQLLPRVPEQRKSGEVMPRGA